MSMAETALMTEPTNRYKAWALPADDSCPKIARGLLRQAIERWKLPKGLIGDATLAVSELATNLIQHVMRDMVAGSTNHQGGGPELWVYRRDQSDHCQLVCKTFDPQRVWNHKPPRRLPDTFDEHGRGLAIVADVSHEWGCHLTRSMLGGPDGAVSGKAVWFSMNIPQVVQPRDVPPVTPIQAGRELQAILCARGIKVIHREDGKQAVISMPKGPTVWCQNQAFSWVNSQTRTRRPLTDIVDTAEYLIQLHEEHDAKGHAY
ncbi:ATP-binding protein [Nonomuraea sp. NPDC046802]|uniref:ATP-binding protein n=1 Tax=Nonomuraea sp. NPDC046802 TaxID=3154919 RepID=UPI0033CC05B0